MPRNRKHNANTLSLFDGYPVELVQRWCMVGKKTAERYKNGTLLPSRRSVYLFNLHRNQKILGPEWNGWRVVGNRLYDPADVPTTRQQIEAYEFIYQLASSFAPSAVAAVLRKLSAS